MYLVFKMVYIFILFIQLSVKMDGKDSPVKQVICECLSIIFSEYPINVKWWLWITD